jgi:nitrate reductase cytochrome c-type subunit
MGCVIPHHTNAVNIPHQTNSGLSCARNVLRSESAVIFSLSLDTTHYANVQEAGKQHGKSHLVS